MKKYLVLIGALAASAAPSEPASQLETLRYEVLAPAGARTVRLLWEGEVSNPTAVSARLSPRVLLLDGRGDVLAEFPLPDVALDRLGTLSLKQIFRVRSDVWTQTVSIDGRATPLGAGDGSEGQ